LEQEQAAPKKKRYRTPVYKQYRPTQDGAPVISSRVCEDVYEFLKSRPEGARAFIERAAREAKRAEEGAK
jgi:hypothetical protein